MNKSHERYIYSILGPFLQWLVAVRAILRSNQQISLAIQKVEMAETILILLPFTPPTDYIQKIEQIEPGYKVIVHQTDMYETGLPKEISDDTWKSVNVLFTWKLLPEKNQVPNLRYVQLLSAGCNQLFGRSVYEQTEIAFCTSNGTHP